MIEYDNVVMSTFQLSLLNDQRCWWLSESFLCQSNSLNGSPRGSRETRNSKWLDSLTPAILDLFAGRMVDSGTGLVEKTKAFGRSCPWKSRGAVPKPRVGKPILEAQGNLQLAPWRSTSLIMIRFENATHLLGLLFDFQACHHGAFRRRFQRDSKETLCPYWKRDAGCLDLGPRYFPLVSV